MIPGEYFFDGPDLELNAGRPVVTLSVNNTGDRPVQIGAHYHFFEVNKALVFDRVKAYGMRLDLPSGTSVAVRARRHQGGQADPLRRSAGGLRVQRPGHGPPGRPLHPRDQPEALHRPEDTATNRPSNARVADPSHPEPTRGIDP